MCHTDMVARDKVYDVPHPIVLGHEGAGIVERVGEDVTEVEVGDPVVLSYLRKQAHEALGDPDGICARAAARGRPAPLRSCSGWRARARSRAVPRR